MADFTGAYLRELGALTNTRHDVESVDRWDLHLCPFFTHLATKHDPDDHDALRRVVESIIIEPGFCDGIDVQPGAQEAVAALSELGDVYVVTSPWDSSPTWMHERARWVARHFPTIGQRRVIQTAQKHLVRGDVFVDDKPEHVVAWSSAWPAATAILFDMHHNRGEAFTETWRGGWDHAIQAAREACT
jgi:5'(3')-deoxyribonucleotidase